jgi:hypothetical protein
MDNVKYFTDELDGTEYVVIDNTDGSFTSMLKSTYDEMIARNEAATL